MGEQRIIQTQDQKDRKQRRRQAPQTTQEFPFSKTQMFLGASAISLVAAGAFVASRYRVARPSEMLVKTGLGIKDLKLAKHTIEWPFQRLSRISLVPQEYSNNLEVMSKEKLQFTLPGKYSIGASLNEDSLETFAKLMGEKSPEELEEIILGIVDGETRSLAASMELEEIFNNRVSFSTKITKELDKELSVYGLKVYNANLRELTDSEGSLFFAFLRQKATKEAEAKSVIDISAADRKGRIGKAENDTATILNVNEKLKEQEASSTALDVAKADFQKQREIATIESRQAAKKREAILSREVEIERQKTETETLRAQDYSKAIVEAQTREKQAEGLASAIKIEAEAKFYAAQQEAKGIKEIYEARAQGISKMSESFEGNVDQLLSYEMISNGVYSDLASKNAEAIQGLNPKITVWNTGNNESNPLANIGQNLPPLLKTIQDQTGLKISDNFIEYGNEEGTRTGRRSRRNNKNNNRRQPKKEQDLL